MSQTSCLTGVLVFSGLSIIQSSFSLLLCVKDLMSGILRPRVVDVLFLLRRAVAMVVVRLVGFRVRRVHERVYSSFPFAHVVGVFGL